MKTKFEISNLALRHIGMRKIGTLEGIDPSAVACNDFFDACRDDVLSEHSWPFALTQQPLETSNEDVPIGWSFLYVYPAENVAKVWSVFNLATADNKEGQDFEVFYSPTSDIKLIASNLDAAYVEYTYLITNELVWSAKFDMVLSYRLAAEICVTLTGDAEKGLKLMAIYNAMLAEEKRVSFSEKRKKPQQKSSYQGVR